MLQSLLEAARSIGPFFLFMVSPILIPLIGVGIGVVKDRLARK